MPACSSCGADIDWAVTLPGKTSKGGELMPVDHDSAGAPDGTLAVGRRDKALFCRVLAPGEEPGPNEKRGRSHWSTCPHSKEHKRS